MNKPLSFAQVTAAVTTNIILPWDKRVGSIRRANDRISYLYSPEDNLSRRSITPTYTICGYGPESLGGHYFDLTFTQAEWAKVQYMCGVEFPTRLIEASPDLGWGGFDWNAMEEETTNDRN